MHHWKRTDAGAMCLNCELVLTGIDAEDVFRGAATPIGQVRLPNGSSLLEPEEEEDQ